MEDVRIPVRRLERNLSPDPCICKVDKEYIPRRIGLGLFHHHDTLSDVVELKMRALKDIVNETRLVQMQDMDETRFIRKVAGWLPLDIQKCYLDQHKYFKHKHYKRLGQAKAFAMDACSVLQFLTHIIPDIINDDSNDMMEDIFTFQNQIPLLLLFEIMKLKLNGDRVRAATEFAKALTKKRPFKCLSPLALSAGEDIICFLVGALQAEEEHRSHHLLHLLHKSIAHFLQEDEHYIVGGTINPMCHNVLESLDTYNIKFNAVEERNENFLRKEGIIQGSREDRFFRRLSDLCVDVTEWNGGVYRTVIDQLHEHSKLVLNRWIFNFVVFILDYRFFGLFLSPFRSPPVRSEVNRFYVQILRTLVCQFVSCCAHSFH